MSDLPSPQKYSWTYSIGVSFKVQESMENLEEIVRERNRAYFELETGGSGERERVIRQGMRNRLNNLLGVT